MMLRLRCQLIRLKEMKLLVHMDNIELKLLALDESIAYPLYKDDTQTYTVTAESFDHQIINAEIDNNEKLTNFEGARIDLLKETIKLLSENKNRFNVSLFNQIIFTWHSIPILVIKFNLNNENINKQRMILVSVKRYHERLNEKIDDKKIAKLAVMALIGLTIVFGLGFGFGAGYAIYRNGANGIELPKIDN
jgi:hypothetical protein